ncbi:hypothetical protein NADE_009274 [Nannochloris sp. 'desiccata']|nr:hypothetical protein NADE_009274 [Chlorella desiccata (nom. nud.)]
MPTGSVVPEGDRCHQCPTCLLYYINLKFHYKGKRQCRLQCSIQGPVGSSNTSSQYVLSRSDQAFQGSQQQALDAFDQGLQEDGYEDYDVMDINPDRVDLSHDEDPAAGGGSANS